MTLGWYCGSDAFGPYDHFHYDVTHCFQSLTILLPPSIFMVVAYILRMSRIHRLPQSSLLLDPLPRFPQIISAFMALLAVFYLIFFVLQSELNPYRIIYPSLSFIAWTLSILLLRFEHSRAVPISSYGRVFYLLSFIASAKQAESSVMNFVFDTPVMAFDILVFLHLFLALFMFRYAITGVGDSSHLSINWQEDLEQGLADEGIEEEASPALNDRSMWKRFLNFSAHGADGDGDDPSINADHSLNSSYAGGVRSSLDVREDRNPFASNPNEEKSHTNGETDPTDSTNPFAAEPPSHSTPAPTPTPREPGISSKVKALTIALREAHMLAGSTISLPSYQDSVVGGRTLIQFQLHIALAQPSITSGDPDVDSVTAWKRYREFEGLHAALVNTGKKYALTPPELPPAPKRKAMEEGRARLEVYLEEVMAQPLYWDDMVEFAGVKERVEYIAGYMQQIKAQREQEARQKEEAVLAAIQAAEVKKREREAAAAGKAQGGPAHANGAVSVVKVTVDRPVGLDYKYQIIAVRVSGWSRWVDDGRGGPGEEGEEEEVPVKGKKGSRSTLTTPVTTPAPSRRKGGSANPSLSTTAFYLTLDFPVKTSIGDYTVYHTIGEVAEFRAALVRYFQSNQPSLVSNIPALVVGRGLGEGAGDEEMLATASGVEVFIQSLITTTAFQCNLLYAFMERRKAREKTGDHRPSHLISGEKPLATYEIATGQWRTMGGSAGGSTVGSRGESPYTSVPASPSGRGEEGGKRKGRGGERKEAVTPINQPLFPEAVAALTPSHASHLLPNSPSPRDPTPLSTSLTSSSPLGLSQSSSDTSTSHRFSASIPSYSHSNPSDPKSHILYLIIVREYFTLTSFIEWQVTRRYRDFEALHGTLVRLFTGYPFPPLPPKSRLGKKRKDGELEQRRVALELYIQQVVNVTTFQVDEFFEFFDLKNSNRQFTVGTQIKQGEPVGGLEGVREGRGGGRGGGEGEEEDDGGREEGVVGRGGRRNGNGSAADRRAKGGGEVDSKKGRAERTKPSSAQPTNPFDF